MVMTHKRPRRGESDAEGGAEGRCGWLGGTRADCMRNDGGSCASDGGSVTALGLWGVVMQSVSVSEFASLMKMLLGRSCSKHEVYLVMDAIDTSMDRR